MTSLEKPNAGNGSAAGTPAEAAGISRPADVAESPEQVGGGAGERVARFLQRQGAPILLALVVLVASFAFPGFATFDNVASILFQASGLGIIAVGMTLVIISGGIDLSVGSVYALGGVLAAWASRYGVLPAFAVPLAVCGLIGLVQGTFIGRFGMPPFIVTLAGLLGARGLALALTDEGKAVYKVGWNDTFAQLGHGKVFGIYLPVYFMVAVFVVGWIYLQRTKSGQALFAVGGSESASTLMGLPVARIKITSYLICGLLAGLAGALNAAYTISGVPTQGVGWELDAIASVVIGGTLLVGGAGSLIGTLAGVLLLKVILNVINQIGTLNTSVQMVVSGAFLAVVVVVQALLTRAQNLRDG